jgi:glycosyltransferase involved in cell wall biosynthesis
MNIADVQKDWRILDVGGFVVPKDVRLISHEFFEAQYTNGLVPVEEIKQCWLSRLFSFCEGISFILWGFQLLMAADKNTVVIVNGSTQFGNYVCLLNYYLFAKSRTVLFWDSHVEPMSRWKKYLAKRCFLGCDLATFWSAKQPFNYAKEFDLPLEKFIFIPYKSNHSRADRRVLPTIDFVFAGGNGKRDYDTLVKAVSGTEVLLIISATLPAVLKTIGDEPNIIPLSAQEPSYAKLMAASRFVVIPMASTGLKGGGEANFCNAMWHGKPIIAMDDVSAEDYIEDGKTGYIVPPGDVDLLRKRILDLWYDHTKCEQMGNRGRELATKYYTQVGGIRRLVKLACLVGKEAIQRERAVVSER